VCNLVVEIMSMRRNAVVKRAAYCCAPRAFCIQLNYFVLIVIQILGKCLHPCSRMKRHTRHLSGWCFEEVQLKRNSCFELVKIHDSAQDRDAQSHLHLNLENRNFLSHELAVKTKELSLQLCLNSQMNETIGASIFLQNSEQLIQ